MASKQLVLAVFNSEADADAAAAALKDWDGSNDDVKLGAAGVLVLDDKGAVKVDKVGKRSTGAGAGIGLVLAMVTPIGLAAGLIGGAALGALHHKGIGLTDADRDRIGKELTGGKAAVGVVVESSEADAVSAKLADLGGTPEAHDLDDAALAQVDAAADTAPAG